MRSPIPRAVPAKKLTAVSYHSGAGLFAGMGGFEGEEAMLELPFAVGAEQGEVGGVVNVVEWGAVGEGVEGASVYRFDVAVVAAVLAVAGTRREDSFQVFSQVGGTALALG